MAAKRRAEEILSAEHARLDAILAAKHTSLQVWCASFGQGM